MNIKSFTDAFASTATTPLLEALRRLREADPPRLAEMGGWLPSWDGATQ